MVLAQVHLSWGTNLGSLHPYSLPAFSFPFQRIIAVFFSSCNGLIVVFRGKSKADSGCFGNVDDDNLNLKMEFLSLVTHRVINQ